jgi:hypothetical protein
MVIGGAGGRRKGRGWKSEAPLRISQNAVKMGRDGRGLLVGPRKLAVQKRDLKDPECL